LDFRDWISSLEKDNKLLKVGVAVDTLDDMGAFISGCDYRGIDMPIHFEQPKGFNIPVLADRFVPDRDLLIIPNVLGMNLEPMAQGVAGSNSKLGVYDGYLELPLNVRSFMGVDCTVPLGLKNKAMKRVLTVPAIEARVDGLWANVFSAK
jgi:3-polyprenyl-4-hydroxybenzoate decarboxylase